MTYTVTAGETQHLWPRAWRLAVIGLCALVLCSCRGRLGRQEMAGVPGMAQGLPGAAMPPAPAMAAWPGASPLPYQVQGPWAPPGIPQPWPQDEYLADGGAAGPTPDVTREGFVRGMRVEDALVHYDTEDGQTHVEPSNRVFVYSPRFRAVRQVQIPAAEEQLSRSIGVNQPRHLVSQQELRRPVKSAQNVQLRTNLGEKSLTTYRSRRSGGEVSQALGPGSFRNEFMPFEDFSAIRLGLFQERETPRLGKHVAAAVTWTREQAVQIILDGRAAMADVSDQPAGTVYTVKRPPGNPRLRVLKVASTQTARPGETVDFTIRFDNLGTEAIGKVTILDNLATRLEYVPDTAQSSVPATFSAQPNEAGSQVLRWEVSEPVKPGRGGIVRFTCRVR